MEKITSRSNQFIKDTKKLLTSSKTRRERGLFVLEGARLSFDVLNSVCTAETLLITEKAYEKYREPADAFIAQCKSAYLISEDVAAKLSETESAQGVFAVCRMPQMKQEITGSVLALDKLQDPANLGNIFRTAEALGIDTVILYSCCDIYNPKVLRASMGGVLRLQPYLCDDLEELLVSLKNRYRIYATVVSQDAVKITDIDFSQPCVCVIGNEANGVEDNIKALADKKITIPMGGRAESLNAGVAAAITMWEMLR